MENRLKYYFKCLLIILFTLNFNPSILPMEGKKNDDAESRKRKSDKIADSQQDSNSDSKIQSNKKTKIEAQELDNSVQANIAENNYLSDIMPLDMQELIAQYAQEWKLRYTFQFPIKYPTSDSGIIFSPDGKYFALLNDRLTRVWDLNSKLDISLIGTLDTGSKENTTSMILSNQGSQVSKSIENTIMEIMNIGNIEFSNDNKLMVFTTHDGTFRSRGPIAIYDMTRKKLIHNFDNSDGTNRLVFSTDGQLLISADIFNSIKIWDLKTGNCIKTFDNNDLNLTDDELTGISSLAISSNGHTFASGNSTGEINVWDLKTHSCKFTFNRFNIEDIDDIDYTKGINDLKYSPSDQYLAFSHDSFIKILDLKSNTCINNLDTETKVSSLAFSPNGQNLACASEDGKVKIWDLSNDKCIQTFNSFYTKYGEYDRTVPTTDRFRTIKFSPNGHYLFIGSIFGLQIWSNREFDLLNVPNIRNKDNSVSIKIDKIENEKNIQKFNEISEKNYLSDTMSLPLKLQKLIAQYSNEWKYLETLSPSKYLNQNEEQPLNDKVVFSDDGEFIATKLSSNVIDIKQYEEIKKRHSFYGSMINHQISDKNIINSMSFSQNKNNIAFGYNDGLIKIYDLFHRGYTHILDNSNDAGHTAKIMALQYLYDDKYLISSDSDGFIKKWNLCNNTCMNTFNIGEKGIYVSHITYYPNGQGIAFGTNNGFIKIMTLKTEKFIKELNCSVNKQISELTALKFSPNGQYLAASCKNGSLAIWDIYISKCIYKTINPTNWITAMTFTFDSQYLICGFNNGCIVTLDPKTKKSIPPNIGHSQPIKALACVSTGELISASLKIYVWANRESQLLGVIPETSHSTSNGNCCLQ